MSQVKLDDDEHELLEAFEAGELVSLAPSKDKLERIREVARATSINT